MENQYRAKVFDRIVPLLTKRAIDEKLVKIKVNWDEKQQNSYK